MKSKSNIRSLLQQYLHIGIAVLAVVGMGVVAAVLLAGQHRAGVNKDVLGTESSGAQYGTDMSRAAHTDQAYGGDSGAAATSPAPSSTGRAPRSTAAAHPPTSLPNAVGSGGAVVSQPATTNAPSSQPGTDTSPGQGSGAGLPSANPPSPVPASVPKLVVFEVLGRRNLEIPISSSEPWVDSFVASDGSPVTWTPQTGDAIYWEGHSVGALRSPAYMILSGSPGAATTTLAYKIIVNDVIAKPGDGVAFSIHVPEFDQTVTLRVVIVR